MHPFVNFEKKVVFWWTAKCGCTTVKSIMLESMVFDHCARLMDVDERSVRESLNRILYRKMIPSDTKIDRIVFDFIMRENIFSVHTHHAGDRLKVAHDLVSQFTNVLFVRDPFKRFVSGVMDKHIEGSFSHVFRPKNFLDAARNIGLLDRHHFAQQSAEAYLPSLKYDGVFDIESIDYSFLSKVLGMRVEPRIMHRKMNFSDDCSPRLSEATYQDLAAMKSRGSVPDYSCFYDEESRGLVAGYYREDFDLMRRWLPSAP